MVHGVFCKIRTMNGARKRTSPAGDALCAMLWGSRRLMIMISVLNFKCRRRSHIRSRAVYVCFERVSGASTCTNYPVPRCAIQSLQSALIENISMTGCQCARIHHRAVAKMSVCIFMQWHAILSVFASECNLCKLFPGKIIAVTRKLSMKRATRKKFEKRRIFLHK